MIPMQHFSIDISSCRSSSADEWAKCCDDSDEEVFSLPGRPQAAVWLIIYPVIKLSVMPHCARGRGQCDAIRDTVRVREKEV